MKNIKFDDYLNEQLKDSEFKKEWELLEEEYNSLVTNEKSKNKTTTTDEYGSYKGSTYD